MEGTVITERGGALVAKLATSGQTLAFTRASVGTGKIPEGTEPARLEGLDSYRMDGKISGYLVLGKEITVTFQVSSADVAGEGFTITEAGLFAQDPDEGEILYAYLDLRDDPQYIYPKNGTIQKFAEIEFTTFIGRVKQITAAMNPGALVTKEMYDAGMAGKADVEGGDASNMVSDAEEPENPETKYPDINQQSPVKQILGYLYRWVKSLKADKVSTTDIVNNCTSAATDKPLAAAVGKTLWDKIVDAVAALGTHKSSADHDGRYYTETEMDTKLGGKANTNHGHSAATQSVNGFMSAADKKKLDGMATNANNYSHPTSSGNKHIPSGGSSGQILRWSADGTAAWGSDNNTTYGTATQSANGLMSAADKKKLDGVATNANNYSHPSTHAASMITQDDTHRFVTDTEKSTWNGKAAGNHNHDGSYVKKNSTAEVGGIMIGNKATDGYGWIDIFFNKIHNYSIYPEQTRLIFKSLHSGPLMGFNFIGAKLMAGGSEVLTLNRLVDNCTSDRTDLIPTAKQAKLLMDKYNQLNSDLAKIGETKWGDSGGVVNVPSGTAKQLASVNVPAGTWIVRGNLRYQSMSSVGSRVAELRQGNTEIGTQEAQGNPNGWTQMIVNSTIVLSGTESISIWAKQTSGGNIECQGWISAVRIK